MFRCEKRAWVWPGGGKMNLDVVVAIVVQLPFGIIHHLTQLLLRIIYEEGRGKGA